MLDGDKDALRRKRDNCRLVRQCMEQLVSAPLLNKLFAALPQIDAASHEDLLLEYSKLPRSVCRRLLSKTGFVLDITANEVEMWRVKHFELTRATLRISLTLDGAELADPAVALGLQVAAANVTEIDLFKKPSGVLIIGADAAPFNKTTKKVQSHSTSTMRLHVVSEPAASGAVGRVSAESENLTHFTTDSRWSLVKSNMFRGLDKDKRVELNSQAAERVHTPVFSRRCTWSCATAPQLRSAKPTPNASPREKRRTTRSASEAGRVGRLVRKRRVFPKLNKTNRSLNALKISRRLDQ